MDKITEIYVETASKILDSLIKSGNFNDYTDLPMLAKQAAQTAYILLEELSKITREKEKKEAVSIPVPKSYGFAQANTWPHQYNHISKDNDPFGKLVKENYEKLVDVMTKK